MFPCHQCGACCRHVGEALAQAAALPVGSVLQQAGASFPYAVLPDGACSQVQTDNRCGCYEHRPLFCDIDRLFEALALPGISLAEWHALNFAACPPEKVPAFTAS